MSKPSSRTRLWFTPERGCKPIEYPRAGDQQSALGLQTTESLSMHIKQTSMFRLLLHQEFNLTGMNKEPNADS